MTYDRLLPKTGKPMAFVKLEDIMGDERELVVFPTVYKDTADAWNKEKILLVTGKVNGLDRSGVVMQEAKILVDSARIVPIDEARAYTRAGLKPELGTPKVRKKSAGRAAAEAAKPATTKSTKEQERLYIRLQDTSDGKTLEKLKSILDDFSGKHEAVLVLGGADKQIIKLPQRVGDSPEMVLSLQKLVGKEHIKFQ